MLVYYRLLELLFNAVRVCAVVVLACESCVINSSICAAVLQ